MASPFRVLAAEDDPEDARVLKMAAVCGRRRILLDVVDDGAAAVAYLESCDRNAGRSLDALPSLVLLDLGLPKLSGLDLLSWIRKHPSFARVPVVILTGSADPANVSRALDLGANSYLIKPCGSKGLERMMESILAYWCGHNEIGFIP